MKNYKTLFAAVIVGLALVPATQAAIITGSLLNQTLYETSPLPATYAPDGTVSSWVISGYGGAGAGLTFVYQIHNGGPDAIDAASFQLFPSSLVISGGVTTDSTIFGAGAFGAAGTPGSATYNRVTPLGAASFYASLDSGGTSEFMYIVTSATAYTSGVGLEQDGFQAQGAILAPVPEPTTVLAAALLLLPLGIGAVRSLRKDRLA